MVMTQQETPSSQVWHRGVAPIASVAQQMAAAYRWVVDGGTAPACLRLE